MDTTSIFMLMWTCWKFSENIEAWHLSIRLFACEVKEVFTNEIYKEWTAQSK